MSKGIIYSCGNTPASLYAAQFLKEHGYRLADRADMQTQYLLLDIPSFLPDGTLRCGKELDMVLTALPANVTICGGNLDILVPGTYQVIDFLKDARYLSENAAITASCALRIGMQHLTATLSDTPVLIIGWGRIGKCLSSMLRKLDCPVTVCARKESDRALLQALGYDTSDIPNIDRDQYRLVYNTAPEPVLDVSDLENCVKIDLASKKGLMGKDVIWARHLPGMYAPESSGKLIADTFIRLTKEAKP